MSWPEIARFGAAGKLEGIAAQDILRDQRSGNARRHVRPARMARGGYNRGDGPDSRRGVARLRQRIDLAAERLDQKTFIGAGISDHRGYYSRITTLERVKRHVNRKRSPSVMERMARALVNDGMVLLGSGAMHVMGHLAVA